MSTGKPGTFEDSGQPQSLCVLGNCSYPNETGVFLEFTPAVCISKFLISASHVGVLSTDEASEQVSERLVMPKRNTPLSFFFFFEMSRGFVLISRVRGRVFVDFTPLGPPVKPNAVTPPA